jgi:hypothetical protein
MSVVLTLLKDASDDGKSMMIEELAKHTRRSAKDVNAELYPHVAAGRVMACTVIKGGKRSTEYRLTGTLLVTRPGPKAGSRATV